jgi:trigger factor
MNVKISKQGKLGRKIQIEVPASEVVTLENQKLQKIAKTIKMDGFRKGKVPASLVKERYGDHLRQETLNDLIKNTLFKAIADEKLRPAGTPEIGEFKYEDGKPFIYEASFELYPEIKLKAFDKLKVEKLVAEVTDTDIEKTLNAIRKQYATWKPVERVSKSGDQVNIDFTGSVGGEEFAGGKAEKFDLALGAKQMIPGFEDGIEGMKSGEEKKIKVTFPKEYGEPKLAGKKAEFLIKMNSVSEAVLPALDDEFAKQLGITEGGLVKLKDEVRKNMTRELTQALKEKLKQNVLNELFENNKLDLPKSMLDGEIERLQQEAQKMFAERGANWEDLKAKSNDVFEQQAEKRVALGLMIEHILTEEDLKLDMVRVRKMIETISEVYEKPEEIAAMFYQDQNRLNNIRGAVLEEQVIEKILESANVREKKASFDDVIKPQDHHGHQH